MKRWRSLRWLIWLALPLLLVWLLSRLPLGEIWAILASISPLGLAGLIAFNGIAMIVFSSRWWLALRAQGHTLSYLTIFRYRMAAFAIGYFTPGTQFGGEPLQIYTVTSRHAVPAASAVASVTLDKLFELLANFSFLALGLVVILRNQLLFNLSPGTGTLGAAFLVVLPLAYLILLWSGRSPLAWLTGSISTRLPVKEKVRVKAQNIVEVVKAAEVQTHFLFRRKPTQILWVVGSSLSILLFSLAEYWLASRVLGAHLNLEQTIIALTASRLAFLTPVPGGLGALEAGQVLALGTMGFDPTIGIAISLWIRVRDTALGLFGLWWGVGLAQKPASKINQPVHPVPSQSGD